MSSIPYLIKIHLKPETAKKLISLLVERDFHGSQKPPKDGFIAVSIQIKDKTHFAEVHKLIKYAKQITNQ